MGVGGNPEKENDRSVRIPDYNAFAKAAGCGNLVAMTVTMPFDHESPVSLADRFLDRSHFFLLESATTGPGQIARYTFMGFDPLATWQYPRTHSENAVASETATPHKTDAIESLKLFLDEFRLAVAESHASRGTSGPLLGAGHGIASMGGAVGWLGYDLAKSIEPTIGASPPKRIGLPDAYMFIPKFFAALDHLTRTLTVVHYVRVAPDMALDALYTKVQQEFLTVLEKIKEPHATPPVTILEQPLNFDQFEATFEKAPFLEAVRRCLEEIRAGEIFQIQIGNRLSQKTNARAFDIFRHLRMLNPSPYMFFYKMDHHIIMGASPEMMVGVSGTRVVHRPIAGTRRRTWESQADARMKTELVNSEKERAEHVMLVDLARNDIGRIARPGTVKVEELMAVEEYSHVFHMVSQVTGERSEGITSFDVMRASFPNGTVTGAPKIRAMQLINSIEPCSREFYAGSLGIFDFDGNLKSTLLIRSMHYKDGVVATQASAGIVYDSVPEQEWLETRNKMAACLTAMQNTR